MITLLSRPQLETLRCDKPQIAFVGGIRSGKTFVGARWTRDRALRFPKSLHMATANSYPQIMRVIVPALIDALAEIGLTNCWRKSDREFRLQNGAKILIASTENFELLRGVGIGTWWADEIRDAPPEAVNVMLGRLSCDKVPMPAYLFTSTPNGRDKVIWERHVDKPTDNRAIFISPTRDNEPNLAPGYLRARQDDYDARTAAQELDAEFVNVVGQVYYPFNRDEHVREVVYRGDEPLRVCWDFNVDNLSIEIAQCSPWAVRWIDEVVIERDASIYQGCDQIIARYRNHRGRVIVYGDASGEQRSPHSGKTAWALVREKLAPAFGDRLDMDSGIVRHNPLVSDRVNSVNRMLRDAKGRIRMYLSPRCKRLIGDLEQVRWDDNGKDIDKRTDGTLTHASDAAGYYIYRDHRPSSFRSEPRFGMTKGVA